MKTNESTERSKASVMKRMSLVAILTLATLMPAVASRGGEEKEGRDKCPKEMLDKRRPDAERIALHKAKECRKELRLSDEQYNKVFQIYKKAFSGFEKKDRQALSEQEKADFRASLEKQMSKVLSDVQLAEWKHMKQHGHGGKHHTPPSLRDTSPNLGEEL